MFVFLYLFTLTHHLNLCEGEKKLKYRNTNTNRVLSIDDGSACDVSGFNCRSALFEMHEIKKNEF